MMDFRDFRLDTEIIDEEFAWKVAREELRETPENVANGVRELRKLLEEIELDNPETYHFPKDNDFWLINFLRICKFYPESARDRILQYYRLREKYASIFNDVCLEKLQIPAQQGNFFVLKSRDQFGRRVIIQQIASWNHKSIDKYELIRAFDVVVDLCRMEPETQIHGAIYIMDLKGLSMSQTLQFSPSFIKALVEILQCMIPLRLKGYHIINNPSIFLPIFKLVRKFLDEKYVERVHMHGTNLEALHRHIGRNNLPECYGGTIAEPWGCNYSLYEVAQLYKDQYNSLH